MTVRKTLLLLIIFLMSGICYGQNKKPIARPDTCKGFVVNVLKNDYDANGDRMRVTKLNSTTFVIKTSIAKKDTGTFSIDSAGVFSCAFQPYFYGKAYFTYIVNDGKSGAGTSGKIVVIKNKDTTRFTIDPCGLDIQCVWTDGCIDDPEGVYEVSIRIGCEYCYGYLTRHDVAGIKHYFIAYTKDNLSGMIEITEDQANYIIQNTCRR